MSTGNEQAQEPQNQQQQAQQPQKQYTPAEQGLQKIKNIMNSEQVMKKFTDMMGKNATGFIVSVLQIVANNEKLAVCEPQSLYNSAGMAATLNLPINSNFQFAHIVPYKEWRMSDQGKYQVSIAQFQMGWRGYVQLAQRTGQYKAIEVTDVREGELKSKDRLTGECVFEWIEDDDERMKLPIIGYVSYFKLLSGFEKALYWTRAKLLGHAKKYSKTYDQQDGKWNTDEDAMCRKTMIKTLLSGFGPMSVEISTAIRADQANVLSLEDGGKFEYPDNPIQDTPYVEVNEEEERKKKAEAALKNAEAMLAGGGAAGGKAAKNGKNAAK